MSVYSTKTKGWRYDFMIKGVRYTQAGFKTKTEAKTAEVDKRKEVVNPTQDVPETATDMDFLELVNRRLDHMQAYCSESYYRDYRYRARVWIRRWGRLFCSQVTRDKIQRFVLKRSKVSAYTANRELVSLRALFNFGIEEGCIVKNPTIGIKSLPTGDKKVKYVPPLGDIFKVISVADADTQDYLWAIRETMARVGEINRMTWEDVNLEGRNVILYTRKKKGGNLTPRKVPMTERLHRILSRRYAQRNKTIPWVFWHTYRSRKSGQMHTGNYGRRKRLLEGLCKRAGVRRFTFHALRHSGASVMDSLGVPLGSIQRILGHENRKTTEIYLQSIGESEREAMEIFESASNFSHTNSHTNRKEQKSNQAKSLKKLVELRGFEPLTP